MRLFRPSGADRDDAALLRAVAKGDAEALAELYDRHAGWLHARLIRRCPDPETTREVVQDTFLTVWRSACSYRDGPVGGWLWVIAARRLVDTQRVQARDQRAFEAEARSGGRVSAAVTSSAEDKVLAGLQYGDVGAALDRISPELREVLRATVVDGLSTREAAQHLGIPEGTVKSRARRARRELRGELGRIALLGGTA